MLPKPCAPRAIASYTLTNKSQGGGRRAKLPVVDGVQHATVSSISAHVGKSAHICLRVFLESGMHPHKENGHSYWPVEKSTSIIREYYLTKNKTIKIAQAKKKIEWEPLSKVAERLRSSESIVAEVVEEEGIRYKVREEIEDNKPTGRVVFWIHPQVYNNESAAALKGSDYALISPTIDKIRKSLDRPGLDDLSEEGRAKRLTARRYQNRNVKPQDEEPDDKDQLNLFQG